MALRIKRHLVINIDINMLVLVDILNRKKPSAYALIYMTDFNLPELKSEIQ